MGSGALAERWREVTNTSPVIFALYNHSRILASEIQNDRNILAFALANHGQPGMVWQIIQNVLYFFRFEQSHLSFPMHFS